MNLNIMQLCINGVWNVLNYTFKFDTYNLKMWYFIAFPIIAGVVFKFCVTGGMSVGGGIGNSQPPSTYTKAIVIGGKTGKVGHGGYSSGSFSGGSTVSHGGFKTGRFNHGGHFKSGSFKSK